MSVYAPTTPDYDARTQLDDWQTRTPVFTSIVGTISLYWLATKAVAVWG
jgi:hypothetical protein